MFENLPPQEAIEIDGLRTGYFDLGQGPTLVLLHSGEFGASSVTSWGGVISTLAESYRVVAPDWLGYGSSAKVFDFEDMYGRRRRHLLRFLEEIDIDSAVFMGSSMGGSFLLREAADSRSALPISAAIIAGGGGFAPNNAARERIQRYDMTRRGMQQMLDTVVVNKEVLTDEYVSWRFELSRDDAHWKVLQAVRTVAPQEPPRSNFGRPDRTVYESIDIPICLIVGADDPLREANFGPQLATRISHCDLKVYPACGHLPVIEYPDRFVADALQFLSSLRLDGGRSD